MEQQPQEQVEPSLPDNPSSNPNESHWTAYVGLGVVALVCMLLFWLMLQTGDTKEESFIWTQDELVAQPEAITSITQGGIQFHSTIGAPIKTINMPEHKASIQVLSIGSITEGPYTDKIVALALYVDGLTEESFYTYAYFVSDEKGNPVAWDEDLNHIGWCMEECGEQYFAGNLAFQPELQRKLAFFPKEFLLNATIADSNQKAYVTSDRSTLRMTHSIDAKSAVATTASGFAIVRDANKGESVALTSSDTYSVLLPFGGSIAVSPEPNFIDPNDVPQLTWTQGAVMVASYRYGQYAYGWRDCYDGVSQSELEANLLKTGVTTTEDPVYEINATKYPSVYTCLHEKTRRYNYDPASGGGEYVDTVSYADFVESHPMFFWKHQLGSWVAFVRSDVVPAAEKAKPVIYLYPHVTSDVRVSVSPIGGFLETIPEYGSGWRVRATPQGEIMNRVDGKKYPYLFWEGGKEGIVDTPTQGFVVPKNEVSEVMNKKLLAFGLNQQERDDFLEYWVPKLSKAPYYFITFIDRSEIDRTAPLSIYPRPDTVIRVLMDYKPLTEPISVDPLPIPKTDRIGFTVVEWGGIVRD